MYLELEERYEWVKYVILIIFNVSNQNCLLLSRCISSIHSATHIIPEIETKVNKTMRLLAC